MYPEDGLCDYIYYTSVVILNRKLTAVNIQISWNVFKSQMKKRRKTGGGIGFDFRYVTAPLLQGSNIKRQLTALVKENIKHYGLLNIMEESYNILEKKTETVRHLITVMKKIQGGDSTRKTIVALGLFKYDENIWKHFKTIFKRVVDEYAADTVIAISSVGAVESHRDCEAVPPSVTTKHRNYPSMERHGELVKASFQYKKSTAVVGLSLEMGVMTYLLKHNSGGAHDIAYKPCLNAGPLSDASMVCPYDTPQAKVESSATVAGYVMRTSQAHVFLGDTVKTIEDKVSFTGVKCRRPLFCMR
ncbi:hypothetical protein HPB48_011782 [Haemaphysalis longicornis]|uniref:Uncharacterized protein n=1 Tax=Haemaphysalis longicornis TaxID=44386 RepID=A0A9J6GBV9_HAELO|nr:hypothetical protein HPB48_011782 [Haemaphysalis longicornis]